MPEGTKRVLQQRAERLRWAERPESLLPLAACLLHETFSVQSVASSNLQGDLPSKREDDRRAQQQPRTNSVTA